MANVKVIVADWSEEIGFSVGSVVRFNGRLYRATQYSRGVGEDSHVPPTGMPNVATAQWELVEGVPS